MNRSLHVQFLSDVQNSGSTWQDSSYPLTVTQPEQDWHFHVKSGSPLLKDMIPHIMIDSQQDLPFIIWLFENPSSPFALPGEIDLYGHDCLHLLLNRVDHSLQEEAFLLGFTMGNDINTNKLHIFIYKLVSCWFYPLKYRFRWEHFSEFDKGFQHGRATPTKNINRYDFRAYQHWTIAKLRDHLKLLPETIKI